MRQRVATVALALAAALFHGSAAHAAGMQVRQALFDALAARAAGEPGRLVDVLVRVRTRHASGASLSTEPLPESLEDRRTEVGARAFGLVSALMPLPDGAPLAPITPHLASSPQVVDNLWAARCLHMRVPASQLAQLVTDPSIDGVFEDVTLQAAPSAGLGQNVAAAQGAFDSWGLHRIDVQRARQQFAVDGRGVVVGHIDTGVDDSHPALQGSVVRFRDFVNGRRHAYDDDGHGTHTAGTIVGRSGIGVAPGASLVVAKALDQNGRGSLVNLLRAMQWMLDPDGDPRTNDRPHLVNNSWGVKRADARWSGFEDTLFWETVRAWRSAGIVPVFSAGNAGTGEVLLPGAYPVNLAVGATNAADGVADFSSSGRCDWIGWAFYKPDISAPGVNIPSAFPGKRTAWISGTSMAAPHVSGVLALSFQLNPRIPLRDRERVLLDAAQDIGAKGRGQRSGEGRLNAFKTLELSKGYVAPAVPPKDFAPVYLRARRFRTR